MPSYNSQYLAFIEKLENELTTYSNNKNLQHDPVRLDNHLTRLAYNDNAGENNYSPSDSDSSDMIKDDTNYNEHSASPSVFYGGQILNTASSRLGKSKINEQQINALETVFKQKQYLNQFEKEQLSNLLNMTPLQVRSLFIMH